MPVVKWCDEFDVIILFCFHMVLLIDFICNFYSYYVMQFFCFVNISILQAVAIYTEAWNETSTHSPSAFCSTVHVLDRAVSSEQNARLSVVSVSKNWNPKYSYPSGLPERYIYCFNTYADSRVSHTKYWFACYLLSFGRPKLENPNKTLPVGTRLWPIRIKSFSIVCS